MIVVYDVTGRDGEILAEHSSESHYRWEGGKHAEILGAHINQLMHDHPLKKVGVITGPGSFTGIRIGISLAMGLGASQKAGDPVIEVFARSRFDLAWRILKEHKPESPIEGVFFPGPRNMVFCQETPESSITIRPYTELKGIWCGNKTQPQENHLILGDLCRHFLKEIKEKTILPTTKPVPLYVRPPDAVVGIPLLQRLLGG